MVIKKEPGFIGHLLLFVLMSMIFALTLLHRQAVLYKRSVDTYRTCIRERFLLNTLLGAALQDYHTQKIANTVLPITYEVAQIADGYRGVISFSDENNRIVVRVNLLRSNTIVQAVSAVISVSDDGHISTYQWNENL